MLTVVVSVETYGKIVAGELNPSYIKVTDDSNWGGQVVGDKFVQAIGKFWGGQFRVDRVTRFSGIIVPDTQQKLPILSAGEGLVKIKTDGSKCIR